MCYLTILPKAIEKATTAREKADYKARKLERVMKNMDTCWNPLPKPGMERPNMIESDDEGEETAKDVHFVFNTELMTEHGDPKSFLEASKGPDAEKWMQASGNEAMNFIKRGSWRKKLRSEVKEEGRKLLEQSGSTNQRTNKMDRFNTKEGL